MDIKEIHNKLDKQCPSDYKINEILSFAYPFRRIKVKATINKSPEKSIQQVYSVFLRSINAGYDTENEIIDFLGLHKEDFVLRELYFLRERGFADLVSGHWIVTEQGNDFIKDNSILKILEEEDFEFLIDAISNEIIAKDFKTYQINKDKKRLISQIPQISNRDEKLLAGKNEEISDIYKQQHKGKAYLVDYDKNNIIFDSENKEFNEYYLIEYIPRIEKQNELEPFIEVRNKDISKEKRISNILAKQYPSIIYQFTNSERNALESILKIEGQQIIQEFDKTEKPKGETKT